MFRDATSEDLNRLVEGNQRLADETEDFGLDESILKPGVAAVLSDPTRGRYYLWEEEGQVAGQLMITSEWPAWRHAQVWWIQSVYIWPEFRGAQRFDAMYRAVKERAQAAGAGGLRLYVEVENKRAQRVYERVGMNGEHYRLYEDIWS